MDEQKKQKILVAALAVAALGAGSYFFLLRDSGGPTQGLKAGEKAERKTRASSADQPARKRAARSKKRSRGEKVATFERKTRKERTRKSSSGRKTRRGSTRKEKKKQDAPAA